MWPPFADSLPVRLGAAGSPIAAPPPSVRGQPRLLLLDDDPFMLGMHARMLRSMGYAMIGTADRAEVALTMLRENPLAVDVIVCDLEMPGMDGIEFLQQVGAGPFRGHAILLGAEGLRVMHTVRKLMGDGVSILGALEKSVGRLALRALLDRWSPPTAQAVAPEGPAFDEEALRAAHQARQWVVHYQPKVDLRSGNLTGMEALVRWNHPGRGLLPAQSFIGTTVASAAIDALTEWVLREAMEQLARWHESGLHTRMSVNVSMASLHATDFVSRVMALARDTGTSPRDLTLEIAERRLMPPSSAPLENLLRLRMRRFGLSIDDFGTGHSSLAQLRDVPFTELKIDRSFVQGARYDQIIRPVLEGSIGIARRMRMESVAEGVETEDDWHLLRDIGCDSAQGWFIGRPMAPDRVPQWLEEWTPRRARLTAK
jgi:EAL domain-containing protein (putative c-di-GMP-specific phosphodiesterase class I)